MVAAGLFQYSDFARNAGDCNRSVGDHYVEQGATRTLCRASCDRPLDVAALDVRFGYGRHRVFHALSVVPAQLSMNSPQRHGAAEKSPLKKTVSVTLG